MPGVRFAQPPDDRARSHGSLLRAVITIGLLALAPGTALAEPLAQARTPQVIATLGTELAVATPGSEVTVALHQRIAQGWHTYWKNPGDSGQKIDLRWTLPDGVTAGTLRYPVPEPIRVGPLLNHGYSHEVTLLSSLRIPADWPVGSPIPVRADATWLVCEDVCIPQEGQFEFSLPTGSTDRPLEAIATLVERAQDALPRPAPWRVSVHDDGATLALRVDGAAHRAGGSIWFFAGEWGHLQHAAPQPVATAGTTLELRLTRGDAPVGDRLDGVLSMDGTGYLVSAAIVAAPAATASVSVSASGAAATGGPGLPLLLLFAFVGGLLLNLMPCVFPVLAVKAMGLVQHAALPGRVRALGGLAYATGVLLAFALLATALLALRAGGEAVGWGFHLQSPTVVALLALVLFAVGLNLSGLLEVRAGWAGAGSRLASRPGAAGSFFTGLLAAVVAAPCTAPFMATAIGVAMLRSAPEAMAVFLALGLGLATPYLGLSCVPGLAARLPRPGAWMESLKQLLAYPMYASAAWLVWVLAQQAGADAVGLALLAMVGLALAAWCLRTAADAGPTRRSLARSAGGVALAGAVAAIVVAGLQPAPATAPASAPGAVHAEPYDARRLDTLLADGGAVLLNVTAAWCVTCKVNERVALSGESFRRTLERTGVTYMQGDWTRRNPELTALLTRFGRAGVPLYVYFPRGGGAPKVLPQVLTDGIIRTALGSA